MDEETIVSTLVEDFGWSEEAARLGVRAGFRCEYCGRDLLASVDDYDAWQREHVIPPSKGGGDDLENLAVSCKTCNFLKRDFVPEGDDRHARVMSATKHIQVLRAGKLEEVSRIRTLVYGGDAARQT